MIIFEPVSPLFYDKGKIKMTGIILAGGKNKRIGQNKSFLKVGNRTIIERVVSTLSKIFNEIIIISNTPEPYRSFGLKIYSDMIPGKNSLGGIYTGLSVSSSQHNFFVACDMPFLNENLIKYMAESINDSDIVIPKTKKGYEPLHAIYSKSCIPFIKKQIDQNQLKIIDFFPYVTVKKIETGEIDICGPEHTAFLNLNTEQDLLDAQAISESLDKE